MLVSTKIEAGRGRHYLVGQGHEDYMISSQCRSTSAYARRPAVQPNDNC